MAFTSKIAGVEGRKMFFGARDEAGKYAHEFSLQIGGKVLKGEWPDFDEGHLSELKNGMEVRLCGVPVMADGEPSVEAHSVVILGTKAKTRSKELELAERDAKKAGRKP